MIRLKEVRYWSIVWGCDVVRVMCPDEHGREYFCEVEAGKGYRDRREVVLEAIREAIERGEEPGEVSVMGLWPSHPELPVKPQGRAPDASESIRVEPVPGG